MRQWKRDLVSLLINEGEEMSKRIRILLVALVLTVSTAGTRVVEACPMCQVANEDETNAASMARPRAYMYSILFMLAMPASIFTVFGVSLYRLSQKRTALNEELFAATNQPESQEDSSF